MKNSTLSILFSLFSTGLFGQSEFAPAGSTWHFGYLECPNWWCQPLIYGVERIQYTGDVMVDSILCKNLGGYYACQQGQKVFYKGPNEQKFRLLYDFSVPPGGVFHTTNPYGGGLSVQVLSAQLDTINGHPITVFHGVLSCEGSIGTIGITYNDRFGATDHYLFYPSVECVPDYPRRHTFRCFEDNVMGLLNPSGIPCEQVVSIFEAVDVEVQVAPNPADQSVQLTLPSHSGAVMLTVRNMLGKTMMQQSFGPVQSSAEISLSQWATGCYSATLTDEAGKPIGTARIIVAH